MKNSRKIRRYLAMLWELVKGSLNNSIKGGSLNNNIAIRKKMPAMRNEYLL